MAEKKVVKGHTLKEYMSLYGKDYEEGHLWDYSIDDFNSNPDKPDPDFEYWLIEDTDGIFRIFEVPNPQEE